MCEENSESRIYIYYIQERYAATASGLPVIIFLDELCAQRKTTFTYLFRLALMLRGWSADDSSAAAVAAAVAAVVAD